MMMLMMMMMMMMTMMMMMMTMMTFFYSGPNECERLLAQKMSTLVKVFVVGTACSAIPRAWHRVLCSRLPRSSQTRQAFESGLGFHGASCAGPRVQG